MFDIVRNRNWLSKRRYDVCQKTLGKRHDGRIHRQGSCCHDNIAFQGTVSSGAIAGQRQPWRLKRGSGTRASSPSFTLPNSSNVAANFMENAKL